VPHDEVDPFYDPDDLSHNLFATGYELDQEGLAITVGGFARDEPGDHEGAQLVDQDTLGRAVRLPTVDRDDLDAAREADIARARRGVRRPADRRGPDEGVPGALGLVRDPERGAGEDASDGSPGDTGPGADDARVAAYLANPKDKRIHRDDKTPKVTKRRKRPAKFEGCTFGIELGRIEHMPSGQMKITLVVPFEDKAEALKLTDTPGLLLEASVSAVEGVLE